MIKYDPNSFSHSLCSTMQHVNLLLVDIYIFFPIGNGVAGIGTKWVFTHKNPTIQLVGPVLKGHDS